MPFSHLLTVIRILIVKALVAAFDKEKGLVGAFSEHCDISRRFVDSSVTSSHPHPGAGAGLPGVSDAWRGAASRPGSTQQTGPL